MNKLKIIVENHETETITKDSIPKSRKTENPICEFSSNVAKKRKISDDGKFHDVSNSVILNTANSNSKATQVLSPCFQECLEDELKCSICKEMFINPVTLHCSHSFCEYCIGQWKNEHQTCPICRQEITNQNVSIVLEKCVSRVLEFSSKKLKNRRKMILLERQRLNAPYMSAPDCDDLRDSFEEPGNYELFDILGCIFDNSAEENIQPSYDDFDQCIIC